MFLVIGLGNPGDEYENTRHNIGFKVLDELTARFKTKNYKSRQFQAQLYEFQINDKPLIAAKPLTFMNSSGAAVSKIFKSKKMKPENLIAVHDDLDLEFAKIRIRKGGSGGGHLGMESIINSLGASDFYRVKIGIGRPAGRKNPAVFVLEPFRKKEIESMGFAVNQAADAIIYLVKFGLEYAMNKYN